MDREKNHSLRLLDTELANQVQLIKNERILRMFACECARLALKYCENSDHRLSTAIEVGQLYAEGKANNEELDNAYVSAREAAEIADETAFDAYDEVEEGKAPRSKYTKAFAVARAAFSARDCCIKPAILAANEAAYEAYAALKSAIENGATLDGMINPSEISEIEINQTIINLFRNILTAITK